MDRLTGDCLDFVIFISLLFIILYSAYRAFIKPAILRQKESRWRNQAFIQKARTIFEHIFEPINGFRLSEQARKASGTDNSEWVYGEIEFYDFIKILECTNPKPNEIFYDFGTGVGKALVVAALFYPFKKCVGIELFENLASVAKEATVQLKTNNNKALANPDVIFEILQQNFLTVDISNADVVFINATCYAGETWEKLNNQLAQQLRPGARVIITTQMLTHTSAFRLQSQNLFTMSWGFSRVSIYEKI